MSFPKKIQPGLWRVSSALLYTFISYSDCVITNLHHITIKSCTISTNIEINKPWITCASEKKRKRRYDYRPRFYKNMCSIKQDIFYILYINIILNIYLNYIIINIYYIIYIFIFFFFFIYFYIFYTSLIFPNKLYKLFFYHIWI